MNFGLARADEQAIRKILNRTGCHLIKGIWWGEAADEPALF
jgi:hypothetical protein